MRNAKSCKMHKLREKDIEIDFSGAIDSLKFDQTTVRERPDFHDLHEMPKVDFIVELKDSIYFIEIKDPEPFELENRTERRFLQKVESGKLENSLVNKYICTFLFRWAECKLEKSVHFIILTSLDDGLTANFNDVLMKRFKDVMKRLSRWSRFPMASCQVLNLKSWSAVYPHWPVTRVNSVDKEG